MRVLLVLSLFSLLVVGPRSVAAPSDEEALAASLQRMEHFVVLLGKVEDESTAKKIKPELIRSYEKGLAEESRLAKIPRQTSRAFYSKHEKRFEKLRRGTVLQTKRIRELPEAFDVLKDVFPFQRNPQEQRTKLVREQLLVLEATLTRFRTQYGKYPSSLSELTIEAKKLKRAIPKQMLVDPWGNPLEYDPKGERNKGTKPDVWSKGVPERNQLIGNWKTIRRGPDDSNPSQRKEKKSQDH